jgi:hypothetical protein
VADTSATSMEGGAGIQVNEVDNIEVVKDLKFSGFVINLVFIYVYFLSVLINVDHGAIPAALNDIS